MKLKKIIIQAFALQIISIVLLNHAFADGAPSNSTFNPPNTISCQTFNKLLSGFPIIGERISPLFQDCYKNSSFAVVSRDALEMAYQKYRDDDKKAGGVGVSSEIAQVDHYLKNSSNMYLQNIEQNRDVPPGTLDKIKSLDQKSRVMAFYRITQPYANIQNISKSLKDNFKIKNRKHTRGDIYLIPCLSFVRYLTDKPIIFGETIEPLYSQCYDNTLGILAFQPDAYRGKVEKLLEGATSEARSYYESDLIKFASTTSERSFELLSSSYKQASQDAAMEEDNKRRLQEKEAREENSRKEMEVRQAEKRRQEEENKKRNDEYQRQRAEEKRRFDALPEAERQRLITKQREEYISRLQQQKEQHCQDILNNINAVRRTNISVGNPVNKGIDGMEFRYTMDCAKP